MAAIAKLLVCLLFAGTSSISSQTSTTHEGKTGTSTPAITTRGSTPVTSTSLATSDGDKIPLATPTAAASNGHCQVYQGGSICQSYRQSKEIFWRSDQRYNQSEWGYTLQEALDTFGKSKRMRMSPGCNNLFLQITCYWFFPQCHASTYGIMPSPVCNGSCQLLQKDSCWDMVTNNQTIKSFVSTLLATPEMTTLPCQYWPPKMESDHCENITAASSNSSSRSTNSSTSRIQVTTCGGGTVAKGTPCVFPFEYNGVQYYKCTQVSSFGVWKHWCATEGGNFHLHRKWGYCDCSDARFGQLNATCEPYHGGDICKPSRGAATVFVDNKYSQEFLGQNIMDKLYDTLEATKDNDTDKCLLPLIATVCHYVFPNCTDTNANYSVYPMGMCKESCEQLYHGHCHQYFTQGIQTTIAHLSGYDPVHIFANVPDCQSLPSAKNSKTQPCMNTGIDLRHTTPTTMPLQQTSKSMTHIAGIVVGAGTVTIVAIILTILIIHRRLKNQHLESQTTILSLKNVADSWIRRTSQCLVWQNEANTDNVLQYPIENIQYVKDLGEGAFGKVFMGIIDDLSVSDSQVFVAVKFLKASASDKVKEDFYKELHIMAQLSHPNIVKLYAKYISDEQYCMMLEYMCHGDLNNFLQSVQIGVARHVVETGTVVQCDESSCDELSRDTNTVTVNDLMYIMMQVCCGLSYLEDKRFVHRDIAARNCLVGKGLTTKISDFGLSRDIYTADYYRVGGRVPLPVRWMAPESILYGKFTSKTDVWSFGVLVWEVFTLGKRPYYGKSNDEVIPHVTSGGRLPPPDDYCPVTAKNIMELCWHTNPDARPNATDLLRILQQDDI